MINTLPTFYGKQALDVAQQVRPLMQLTVYAHVITLRKETENGAVTEFPIDPAALATTLAARVEFGTGLLTRNTIYVGQVGIKQIVIEYRKPQMIGLWLEGSETPLRIPFPGLIMARTYVKGGRADYRMFAVKGRPKNNKVPLFGAPLPHTNSNGMCWGTVAQPGVEALQSTSLAADWQQFLGSKFGNHTVDGKSKAYPKDLRKLLISLEGKDKYPLDDLVPAEKKLGELIKELHR